ncbi:MAG: hypothetical protein ABSH39_14130 [Candidatus Acidiferrum sp.]
MVVEVGLTLLEPLADVEVKLPGEMEIVLAPAVDQLSVTFVPEVMVVRLAVKELMVGAELGPGFPAPDIPAQPVMPRQARRKRQGKKELGAEA